MLSAGWARGLKRHARLANGLAGVARVSAGATLAAVPLPLDLTPVGVTGCTLAVEIPLLFPASSTGGSLSWSLPIGTTPDLLGFAFYTQSLQLDLAANPFGATTSNGLRHRIGGR